MSFAKVHGVARVTRPIETKFSNAGKEFRRVGLVFDNFERGDDGKPAPLWVDMTVFEGQPGYKALDYLNKGDQVEVGGRLGLRHWVGDDGRTNSSLYIGFPEISLVGNRRSDDAPTAHAPADDDLDMADPFKDE